MHLGGHSFSQIWQATQRSPASQSAPSYTRNGKTRAASTAAIRSSGYCDRRQPFRRDKAAGKILCRLRQPLQYSLTQQCSLLATPAQFSSSPKLLHHKRKILGHDRRLTSVSGVPAGVPAAPLPSVPIAVNPEIVPLLKVHSISPPVGPLFDAPFFEFLFALFPLAFGLETIAPFQLSVAELCLSPL